MLGSGSVNPNLFLGITDSEKCRICECFGMISKKYAKDETIANIAGRFNRIGVLENGRAHIYCVDAYGRRSVVEQIESGDVFGEIFTCPADNLEYYVTADMPCTVTYIDYSKIIKPCSNFCTCHTNLLHNLFDMAAKKSGNLLQHINVLSQRTIREKLLAYFDTQCADKDQKEFLMPISFTALADYINADRSAMMREIGKMKAEGIIETHGKRIRINE